LGAEDWSDYGRLTTLDGEAADVGWSSAETKIEVRADSPVLIDAGEVVLQKKLLR
jgi:hypothetical protein